MEYEPVDWDSFDALFIGGSTEWKLGPEARAFSSEAKARGKWLHMGRVNTWRRYEIAESFGCDSVDGTTILFGPSKNLPIVLGWGVRSVKEVQSTTQQEAHVPSFASTDGPKQAVPIKNHRYQIPRYPIDGPIIQATPGTGMLVPWTRVSTILDTHEDKEGIFKWTKRLVVKGLGAREDLYALAAAARLEDKAGLLKIADQAFDYAKGQASSNLGTALHGFLERWVEGDKDLVIPTQWKGDVAAVMAAFQDANIRLRPDLQEMVVVRPDLKDGDAGGLAGRLDLVVEMLNPETGEWELILADYKTGSDPLLYGAWKIQQQLGLYGTAWAIWDGTHWRPMPTIRRDKILMVHVLPGQASVQIHIGDVDPVELEADLQAAYRTRRRRKEAKKAWRPLVTVEDGTIVGPQSDTYDGDDSTVVTTANTEPGDVQHPTFAVGPTKPITELEQSWRDSSTPEQVARAEATVARVAAESNPNLDGDETADNGHTHAAELAPLAGPGERGCGVCGRKGHRRGSPKCLGEADPRLVSRNTAMRLSGESDEDYARGAAERGELIEREANGGPTDAGHCRCSIRSAGWKAPADGVGPWVCGDCGLPSMIIVPLAVQTGEQTAEPISDEDRFRLADAERAQREQDDPRNHAFEAGPGSSGMVCTRMVMRGGGGDECGATPAAHEPSDEEVLAAEAEEPDPFDEDGSDTLGGLPLPTWMDRINYAADKAELRSIRAEAMKVGEWTQELTRAGLERIKVLAQQS